MAADPLRLSILESASTVVVKVGTNVLTNHDGLLDRNRIESLTAQIARIKAKGRQVVLVSSGAIGAGVGRLGLRKRPSDLPHLQACAAVGQSALMQMYQESLNAYHIPAAQILLTAGDFDSRVRYLNTRNTIATLFEWNSLPIINENDTVSIAEIKFGDNDQLAAMVTNLLQAPLLILLTNVNGLYSSDPRVDPDAQLVHTVPNIDSTITSMAGTSQSQLGTGGMKSKLSAARIATSSGGSVIMANGAEEGILDRLYTGEQVGTLFLAHGESIPAWKRWLGYTAQPRGSITVDAGARKAIIEKGTSLLPVGIRSIAGEFGKGDIVSVLDQNGEVFARGLSNYAAEDIRKIMGLGTREIHAQLGKQTYDEVIHRDNLALTRG